MPTTGKLLVVLAVAVPVVLAGGYAYKRAMQCTWQEAMTKAYHVMSNCPGVDITQEQTKAGLIIVNTVYLAGVLGFAAVLGIVTDDIGQAVAEVRTGNFPVVERNHTVMIGWNRQTLPTLRQIAIAQAQAGAAKPFGMPVVVLADSKDKEEMDAEILEELQGRLPVITRVGSGARLEDLRRVASGAAATVLVQHPDGEEKDKAAAEQAATLAALKREGGPPGQRVVVQGDGGSAEGYDAAAVALQALNGGGGGGGGSGAVAELVVTKGGARLSQFMVQAALQPGLEYVLGDLLEFEDDYRGAEFYMAPLDDDMAGRPYKDIRRSFQSGVVVGFVGGGAATGKLSLNPKDSEAVPSGSQLVFVTSGSSVERTEGGPMEAPLPRLRRARGGHLQKKHVAVLCFGPDTSCILEALKDFCPRGSRVTLISSDPSIKEAIKPLHRRGIRAEAVVGGPGSGAVLREARLERADAAVLCGLWDGGEGGDAQAVASVLQLQALSTTHLREGRRSSPLDVVLAVNSTSTEETLWHATLSHEAEAAQAEAEASLGLKHEARPRLPSAVQLHMLNPDQLMSGMVTQAAIEPRLNRVFAELFTNDEGQEIYLRRAASFGLPPAGKPSCRLSFAQIQEAARAKGQTAIGVAPRVGGPDAIRLAPAPEEEFDVSEADEIVVIAAE